MIAPVLAGETLKSLVFQSRVVTDPIKNPLIGWWKEYYFFYVKLTDIDYYQKVANDESVVDPATTDLVAMLLNDAGWVPGSSYIAAGSDKSYYYTKTGQQGYVEQALAAVVTHYFRDENEAYASVNLDGVPLAMINNTSVLNSAMADADMPPEAENTDLLGDASDADLYPSEIEAALKRYQAAKVNGLTDASFEDYLADFGIKSAVEDPHRPELVRYVRLWQYPSNTVEPTTGTPSSAVSWSVQERADKDRFFREPGFLLGVSVTRPKVYLSGQTSNISGWLDRAQDWMHPQLVEFAKDSFKNYDASSGPFSGVTTTGGYWLDMRDLFLYGDQFVNFALSETDAGLVALPTAALQKKFVSDADVDALFVTPASKQWVREDGMAMLTIAGRQRDMSPTV